MLTIVKAEHLFDWKDVFSLFEVFQIAYHSLKEIGFNMDLPDINFFSNDTIESVLNKVKLNKNGFIEISNESLHVHHINFPKEHVPQMRAKPKKCICLFRSITFNR